MHLKEQILYTSAARGRRCPSLTKLNPTQYQSRDNPYTAGMYFKQPVLSSPPSCVSNATMMLSRPLPAKQPQNASKTRLCLRKQGEYKQHVKKNQEHAAVSLRRNGTSVLQALSLIYLLTSTAAAKARCTSPLARSALFRRSSEEASFSLRYAGDSGRRVEGGAQPRRLVDSGSYPSLKWRKHLDLQCAACNACLSRRC